MKTLTAQERSEIAKRAVQTRIRRGHYTTIVIKASEVLKAIARADETFDDWQARRVEIAFIPKVNKRFLEANNNRTLFLERVPGKPYKGMTRDDNLAVGARKGWGEFAGYQLRYGEHYGWNFKRDDWYGHSPSTTWDGIRRELNHSFIESLYAAALNARDGKLDQTHYSVFDNLTQYGIRFVNDL